MPCIAYYLFPDIDRYPFPSGDECNRCIILFLDPKLSILMDQDKLHSALLSYLYGRVIGFLLALFVITIIFFKIIIEIMKSFKLWVIGPNEQINESKKEIEIFFKIFYKNNLHNIFFLILFLKNAIQIIL